LENEDELAADVARLAVAVDGVGQRVGTGDRQDDRTSFDERNRIGEDPVISSGSPKAKRTPKPPPVDRRG
jgi:hypothetical protein